MRYSGAKGEGAMARAICQGIGNREVVDPSLFQEILTRNHVGSRDRNVPFGGKYHEGCDTAPSHVNPLTCTREGMQAHPHQATILHGFPTRILRECRIPHEEESIRLRSKKFKEGIAPESEYLPVWMWSWRALAGRAPSSRGRKKVNSTTILLLANVLCKNRV